ncbi:gasdermin Eb isoform X2 [Etheostoma spectabile]|uniref:gasdermin Eb isoform X2 n=1 Tax=Etheostoma spectabile TaxID=54343 RepID=UPI0013AF4BA5|nr:gasdermin-E isoform X2 [Etheostoma spectabile]XP_032375586.1 gasdermin-E isoform X2 [Etheostoma spectabile]
MFATATRNFVEEVDNGGLLIPVSSLNDTIALLTVVVKRKRFWVWQKPKYIPSDFNLNDILTGDIPMKPDVIETDFIKYNGTFGDNIQATVDANFVHASVSVEGKDSSKLQSSFGSLKKEEVDVQKLLRDSKSRVLDMSHDLIQQTKEKPRQVFGFVKERIVTTQPSSVIEEVQQGAQCGGGLSLCGPKRSKVSLKENGSLSKDSNITMEIPIHTTIAYALLELEIKQDGRFEMCLMSDTTGGFEVDGLAKRRPLGVFGAPASEKNYLRQELEQLSDHFQLLSSLPATTRSFLLQQITKVMEDRGACSSLQNALEQMCLDERPALGDVTTTEPQKQNIRAILDLLEQSGQVESTPVLTALNLVTSAMDEMTNDCLAVLGVCCSLTVLQALELLVQCVSGKGELHLSGAGLAALTEDVFEKTEHLFALSNVSLERDGDTVKTKISHLAGNRPLVLCIAVRGLASLAHCD